MKLINRLLVYVFVVLLICILAISNAEETKSKENQGKEESSLEAKKNHHQHGRSPFRGLWEPSSEIDLFEDVFAPMERYFDRIRSHTASLMDQAFDNDLAHSPFSFRGRSSWPSFRSRPSASSSSPSSSSGFGHGLISSTTPRMDLRETDKEYLLDCDLPGVKKEDIDMSLSDDNVLTIKAHRDIKHEDSTDEQKSEKGEKEEGPNVIRQERYHSEFERKMRLSDEIDRKSIEAKYENGVLHLKLPKVPHKKPTEHKINIQ